MEKIQILLDNGMKLLSTPRQLKNGTYVLHAIDIKTKYYIYTEPTTGNVKRTTYTYDLQHHSQHGGLTQSSDIDTAIGKIFEHHKKYLKRHIDGSFEIPEGTLRIPLILACKEQDSPLPPRDLFFTLFSKCKFLVKNALLTCEQAYEKVVDRYNNDFFICNVVAPTNDETLQLEVLVNTVYKAYIPQYSLSR